MGASLANDSLLLIKPVCKAFRLCVIILFKRKNQSGGSSGENENRSMLRRRYRKYKAQSCGRFWKLNTGEDGELRKIPLRTFPITLPGLLKCLEKFAINHCNLAYSDLACLRVGMSESGYFQRARKSDSTARLCHLTLA